MFKSIFSYTKFKYEKFDLFTANISYTIAVSEICSNYFDMTDTTESNILKLKLDFNDAARVIPSDTVS